MLEQFDMGTIINRPWHISMLSYPQPIDMFKFGRYGEDRLLIDLAKARDKKVLRCPKFDY